MIYFESIVLPSLLKNYLSLTKNVYFKSGLMEKESSTSIAPEKLHHAKQIIKYRKQKIVRSMISINCRLISISGVLYPSFCQLYVVRLWHILSDALRDIYNSTAYTDEDGKSFYIRKLDPETLEFFCDIAKEFNVQDFKQERYQKNTKVPYFLL